MVLRFKLSRGCFNLELSHSMGMRPAEYDIAWQLSLSHTHSCTLSVLLQLVPRSPAFVRHLVEGRKHKGRMCTQWLCQNCHSDPERGGNARPGLPRCAPGSSLVVSFLPVSPTAWNAILKSFPVESVVRCLRRVGSDRGFA